MVQITEGVYFIKGQDEFFPDSHSYLLGNPDSEDFSLIDPGLMGKGDYKLQSIQDMGIDLKHIKRVIMTHTHVDHIGCLAEIMDHLPWAQLWLHETEAEPLAKGDERNVYGVEMFSELCMTQYHLKPGVFSVQADMTLKGEENLEIGDMTWQVLHIPGHSVGSIGLYNKLAKVLIPGDVVYADYSIGRFDLFGASASEHKASLFRLAELEIDVLLPGHNRILEDVPAGYIMNTAQRWAPYLS